MIPQSQLQKLESCPDGPLQILPLPAGGPEGSLVAPGPALSLAISAVAALLFSAYLLYDLTRIVQGGETNYITATLAVYLDIYNIFVSLLNLFMAFGGERD